MTAIPTNMFMLTFITEMVLLSSSYIGEWSSPPLLGPSNGTVDGPLLGNGDIGSFVCGNYNNLTFYIGKNDFWYFNDTITGDLGYHNRVLGLGGITFILNSGNNNKKTFYYLQQNSRNGTIQFNIGNISGNATISQSNTIPNILMINFTNIGNIENIENIQQNFFCLPSSQYAKTYYGKNNNISYCQRITTTDNVTAVIAYSSKYFNQRKSLIYIFSIMSSFNVDRQQNIINNATQNVINYLNIKMIDDIITTNNFELLLFWNLANISLPNEALIESYWYKSLYLQFMSNRETAKISPGLWGPFLSTDYMGWNGDYTLNYNFEAPYYGIYTANRISLASTYYETIMDYTRNGKSVEDALNYGCRGIHYPAHIAPFGNNNSFDWGQHSSASFAALNFVQHFKYTSDISFMTKNNYEFYKFLYNITEWWLCWTNKSWDDTSFNNYGGYVDAYDCTREGCDPNRIPLNINPAISLSFMKYIVDNLLNISYIIGIDNLINNNIIDNKNKTDEWIKMSESIAPLPIGIYNESVVLLPQSVPYYFKESDNPLQFYGIHPGNQIGYGSSSKLMLQIAQNTINKTNTWIQNNCLPETYPAAIRCGYPINETLSHLNELLIEKMPSNGYVRMGGGGLDSSGAILAINEMLLMSWDGIIRIFEIYNYGNAQFHNLRAIGAFLVSAKMVNSNIVSPIYVLSEKGNWFNFQLFRNWNMDQMKIIQINQNLSISFSCNQDEYQHNICSFTTMANTAYHIIQ